jgi:signal recognition particle receptor subunit beta
MVFFNYATMQMAAKIVYYGPGLCGKTTNLQHVYNRTSPQSRGEMVSLETETDRTLFFDLLPLDVGVIGGFKTRLQLYTVPGQVFYNTTRKLVLKGADGIVFVADSQEPMLEANVQSLRNLRANLDELGIRLDEIPMVVQLNKRDLPNVLDRQILEQHLNPDGQWSVVEASAVRGEGVFETLKIISKLTLKMLRARMSGEQESRPAISTFEVRSAPSRKAAEAAPPSAAAETFAPAPDSHRTVSIPNPLAEASVAEPSPSATTGVIDQVEDEPPRPEEQEPASTEPEPSPAAQAAPPAEPEAPDEATDDEGAAEPSAPVRPDAEQTAEPPAKHAAETDEETRDHETPVKRVKLRSSVDIMSELENLRRRATGRGGVEETTRRVQKRDLHKTLQLTPDPDVRERLASVAVTIEMRDQSGATLQTETKSYELTAEEVRKLLVSLNIEI